MAHIDKNRADRMAAVGRAAYRAEILRVLARLKDAPPDVIRNSLQELLPESGVIRRIINPKTSRTRTSADVQASQASQASQGLQNGKNHGKLQNSESSQGCQANRSPFGPVAETRNRLQNAAILIDKWKNPAIRTPIWIKNAPEGDIKRTRAIINGDELRNSGDCGANGPGGGFQPGNTCGIRKSGVVQETPFEEASRVAGLAPDEFWAKYQGADAQQAAEAIGARARGNEVQKTGLTMLHAKAEDEYKAAAEKVKATPTIDGLNMLQSMAQRVQFFSEAIKAANDTRQFPRQRLRHTETHDVKEEEIAPDVYVDQSLAGHIRDMNKAGFQTIASDSAIKEEHPGLSWNHPETGMIIFRPKGDQAKTIIDAAKKVGATVTKSDPHLKGTKWEKDVTVRLKPGSDDYKRKAFSSLTSAILSPSAKPVSLSDTQREAVAKLKEHGNLVRQPGGFWTHEGAVKSDSLVNPYGWNASTQTVQALANKGVIKKTDPNAPFWKAKFVLVDDKVSNAAPEDAPDETPEDLAAEIESVAASLSDDLKPVRDRLDDIEKMDGVDEMLDGLRQLREDLPTLLKDANATDETDLVIQELMNQAFFDGVFDYADKEPPKESHFWAWATGVAAAVAAGTFLSSYSKDDLDTVSGDISDRADAVAKTTRAEVLGDVAGDIDDMMDVPDITEDEVTSTVQATKRGLEYDKKDPDESDVGLSSDGSVIVATDTNTQAANGYGKFMSAITDDALEAFPLQEFYRAEDRKEWREWPTRWLDAGGPPFVPGESDYPEGRMIAPVDDDVWTALSRWGDAWPPYDYNSGCSVRPVGRKEGIELGIWSDSDSVDQPDDPGFNNNFGVNPDVPDDLKNQLLDDLGEGFEEGEDGGILLNCIRTTAVDCISHGQRNAKGEASLLRNDRALPQPKGRILSQIRGAWDNRVREVARELRCLLGGYEVPKAEGINNRKDRRNERIQPGELSVGDARRSKPKQARQSLADPRGQNDDDMRLGEGYRDTERNNRVQDIQNQVVGRESINNADPWMVAECDVRYVQGRNDALEQIREEIRHQILDSDGSHYGRMGIRESVVNSRGGDAKFDNGNLRGRNDAVPDHGEEARDKSSNSNLPKEARLADGEDILHASTAARLGNRAGVDEPPSDAQKQAGNYKKRRVEHAGMQIAIENEKGSERSGTGPDGVPWAVQMTAPYGYVAKLNSRTAPEGVDGDKVDVYLNEPPVDGPVFIVDQMDAESGDWDEHKVFLGFPDEQSVRDTYAGAFSDGKADQRLGALTAVSMDDFKKWLTGGDTEKPYSDTISNQGKRFAPTWGDNLWSRDLIEREWEGANNRVANAGTSDGAEKGWETRRGGAPTGPVEHVNELLPNLAKDAQSVYDEWQQDDEGMDEVLGGGGICQDIADKIAGTLGEHGIDAATVSATMGDQHVWVVAKLKDGVYNIDIPPHVYESGSGYTWKKKNGVAFSPDHIVVEKIDRDPEKFDDYIENSRQPSINNAGTPEGAEKGWETRRSHGAYASTNDVKAMRVDKDAWVAAGRPSQGADEIVAKYFKPEAYSHLAHEDNLYLTMPSTSGKNVLPFRLAQKLQEHYGGEIYSLPAGSSDAHAESKHKTTWDAKIRDPFTYHIPEDEAESLRTAANRKNLVVVDDVQNTGESDTQYRKALADIGLSPRTTALLGATDLHKTTPRDIERMSEKIVQETGEPFDKVKHSVQRQFGHVYKNFYNIAERQITNRPKKIRELWGYLQRTHGPGRSSAEEPSIAGEVGSGSAAGARRESHLSNAGVPCGESFIAEGEICHMGRAVQEHPNEEDRKYNYVRSGAPPPPLVSTPAWDKWSHQWVVGKSSNDGLTYNERVAAGIKSTNEKDRKYWEKVKKEDDGETAITNTRTALAEKLGFKPRGDNETQADFSHRIEDEEENPQSPFSELNPNQTHTLDYKGQAKDLKETEINTWTVSNSRAHAWNAIAAKEAGRDPRDEAINFYSQVPLSNFHAPDASYFTTPPDPQWPAQGMRRRLWEPFRKEAEEALAIQGDAQSKLAKAEWGSPERKAEAARREEAKAKLKQLASIVNGLFEMEWQDPDARRGAKQASENQQRGILQVRDESRATFKKPTDVWRGLELNGTLAEAIRKGIEEKGYYDIPTRRLSSWTGREKLAEQFAKYGQGQKERGRDAVGLVVKDVATKDNVWMHPDQPTYKTLAVERKATGGKFHSGGSDQKEFVIENPNGHIRLTKDNARFI